MGRARRGGHLQAFLDIMIHNNFFMNIGCRPLVIVLSLSIFEMQSFYAFLKKRIL